MEAGWRPHGDETRSRPATGAGQQPGPRPARNRATTAAAAALLHDEGGNRTYELGGPAFDVSELARVISEVTGTKVTYHDLPPEHYAKQTAAAFLDAIGYDAYDVGPLSEGWRFEAGAIAYAYSTVRGGSWPVMACPTGATDDATRSAAEVLSGHVVFELECIDRIYRNLYVPKLQRELGVASFIRGTPARALALRRPRGGDPRS
jgi:hypothetical protein